MRRTGMEFLTQDQIIRIGYRHGSLFNHQYANLSI